MSKKSILLGLSLLAACAAGLGAVHLLFPSSPAENEPLQEEEEVWVAPVSASSSIATVNMEKAALVEGLTEVDPEETSWESASQMPSQLSKIKVAGIVGVAPKPTPEEQEAQAQEQQPGFIPIEVIQKMVKKSASVPSVSQPQEAAAADEASSITMLKAPVKVRLIKNTQDYKKFKTVARGKYPQVDFNRQMIVVLESDSNLPDKVFEIQKAETKNGKIEVTYRVNVFGLEDKLNTHSVHVVQKSTLPVELKQVI